MASLEKALEDLKKEFQDFAYTMSHDFSTPLRQINAFASLIHENLKEQLDDETQKYFDFIFSSTKKGQDKIDALLAYSRLNTQAQPFEKTKLKSCYREACKDLSERISDSKAELHVGSLPELNVDAAQMKILFFQLIDNGIKFQRADQVPVIHVDAKQLEHGWEISFTDNGMGIPKDYREKIFDIFYRGVSDDEYPGTGVGLTLAQKIARRHGGDICIEDNPGGGTICKVTINT